MAACAAVASVCGPAEQPEDHGGEQARRQDVFKRLRTVPPMSAPCEPDDAIVVSEMGEIESPKVAPARMAPASIAGLAPTAPPAG